MTRSDVEGRYSAKRSFDIALADIELYLQSGVRCSALEYRTLLNQTKKRSGYIGPAGKVLSLSASIVRCGAAHVSSY